MLEPSLMVGGRVVDVFLKTTLVQFLPCIHCMMLPEAEFSWYITTGHGSGSGWWCSTCGSQYVFRSNACLFGMQTGNTPDTVKYWFSEPPPQSCMNFIEIMKIGTNMRHGNNPYDKSPPYMPDQNRSGDQNFCGERWNVAQHDAKHNGVEESGGYCETSGWWRQVPMPSHRWIAQRTNAFSAKDAGAQVTAIAIWSMTYWSTERCVACLSSLMLVRET